ncbi:hypothetical protein PUN28_010818 [Cardiocondyla obscurior]
MRCATYENSKRLRLNDNRDVKHMATMTNDKKMKKDDSPGGFNKQLISSHSTPITKNLSANMDIEDSPDLDYCQSLFPCTQEGGNEVAWDWQSSLSRTPENKKKQKNIQCETPKGTKFMCKKRISNSPLLYKPLKRKAIKRENIENIGQFAAELQALSEKIIKQNDKSHLSDCNKKKEAPMLNENNEKETLEVTESIQNCTRESDSKHNSVEESHNGNLIKKKNLTGSYDDLFDDSADDDMIRCTQEMEEKINLMEKECSVNVSVEQEQLHIIDTCKAKTFVQASLKENNKKSLVKSTLGTSDCNTLKTYSKLKRELHGNVHTIAAQKSVDLYKPCLNNNNTLHSHGKKSSDNKTLLKSNTVELFEFSDDSFDDWLATCVDDEKVLLESDHSLTQHKEDKFQSNYKHLTNAPLKPPGAESLKLMAKPGTSNTNVLENRKFFKTKSLSDQYVNRAAAANVKNATTNASYYARHHLNSGKGPILRTNVAHTSVSTKPIATNDGKVDNTAISLMHGADRPRGFGVNRCVVKSDNDRFVKHHSTGNIKNNTPEKTKTKSQPVRCTAEEIEKKRLQAVAKLEAKRKLYSMKMSNNINR